MNRIPVDGWCERLSVARDLFGKVVITPEHHRSELNMARDSCWAIPFRHVCGEPLANSSFINE